MTMTLSRRLIAYVAGVSSWPVSLLAAAPDSQANLSAAATAIPAEPGVASSVGSQP